MDDPPAPLGPAESNEFDETQNDHLPPPPEDEEDDFDDDYGDVGRVPAFASKPVKDLEKVVDQTKEVVEVRQKELQEVQERLNIMSEHLKNVGLEVNHTTGLVNATKKEIETEDHMTQLVVREAGRYQQEFKRLEEANELADSRLALAQNSIFKGNERMDQFKLEMNWNQEELEQWATAAKQKEEDNLAVQKHTRADEAKIKELSLQLEKFTKTLIEEKAKLENEATETQARQIELDKTAEEFRTLHAERQKLVRQWQDTIEAIQRRDGTIQELAMQYTEEKRKHEEQQESLQVQKDHLKGITSDNGQVEDMITQLERQVQNQRSELLESQARLQEFTDELDVLKNELSASANALMKKRHDVTVVERSVEERRVQLEDARRKYQQVKRALEEEKEAVQRTELTAKEAEERLAVQEATLKKRQASITKLKETMFRQSQHLFSLRQEEANYIAEISGSQAAARNLQSKIRQLDGESMRQQELIYNAEFQIQQMERKVARGLGERSDEEKKKLNAEIQVLEGELNQVKDQRKMLSTQCRKLNNELRATIRAKEEALAHSEQLSERIAELDLETTSHDKSLDRARRAQSEKLVQNDVMRLEMKRLRGTLSARTDRVFSLENRRQQLELSMEERKKEISVHQEVQRAQLRVADEERHKVTVELGQRQQAVKKIRDKFEVLVKVSAVRSEEDGGEPKSQAYYIIRAAQRKEEIQRQGDELDDDIRKLEREIRDLSRVLQHTTQLNSKTRVAHQRADLGGEAAEKLRRLEEEAKVANDTLLEKKKALQALRTKVEEDLRRLEQVEVQVERLDERNGHLESAKAQMSAELSEQTASVHRTNDRIAKLSRTHRESLGLSEETVQEKEFRMESVRDTTRSVLYTLHQLSREYPEIQDALDVELRSRNLALPAKPSGAASVGSGDVMDDVSGSRENDSQSHNSRTQLPLGNAQIGF